LICKLITFHMSKKSLTEHLIMSTLSLQIRLPTLQNNGIKDVLGLFIQKVLVGLKWQEFIKIIVDFVPPGMKLTDLSFT
jgi:hypothetical protein